MNARENWADGDRYERYMGQWSRLVAARFLRWLDPAPGLHWLDVGCGTGALSAAILVQCNPARVVGIDRTPGFVNHATATITDARAYFEEGEAGALPVESGAFDWVVSGLALNFFPDTQAAFAEMVRALAPGGSVALYIWDYAEGMERLRLFWEAAATVDPGALEHDEGIRFPICRPEPLRALFAGAGLAQVEVTPIEIDSHYANFDAYWATFAEGGPYPAPAYLLSRPPAEQAAIRDALRALATPAADGSITLPMRAWAARGHLST